MNAIKSGVIILVALTVLLSGVVVFNEIAGLHVYEDGSYVYENVPGWNGCMIWMGCLAAEDIFPDIDEEWLDSAEYTIGGPLVQDNYLVISGFDPTLHYRQIGDEVYKVSFWNCWHAVNLCVLTHDRQPLFYALGLDIIWDIAY